MTLPFTHKQFALYASLFLLPVISAVGYKTISAKQLTPPQELQPAQSTVAEETSASSDSYALTGAPTTYTNASATSNYEYELSLAQGFLKKAVALSNQSQVQSVEEKNKIVPYLNQAVGSASRAIELNANDARGFAIRAKIYTAIASINPEMQTLADADTQQAASLSGSTLQATPIQENPLDLLPTQQAQAPQATDTLIAAPTDGEQATLQSTTETNATSGTAIIKQNEQEVRVDTTALLESSLVFATGPDGVSTFIKNKEPNNGFTVGTTAPVLEDTQIHWVITQQ